MAVLFISIDRMPFLSPTLDTESNEHECVFNFIYRYVFSSTELTKLMISVTRTRRGLVYDWLMRVNVCGLYYCTVG